MTMGHCVPAYLGYADRALRQLKKGRPLMKYLLASAAILSAAALVTLGTAAGFPPRVHYIDHDKVAAAFVKGGPIIQAEGLIAIPNPHVPPPPHTHPTTTPPLLTP